MGRDSGPTTKDAPGVPRDGARRIGTLLPLIAVGVGGVAVVIAVVDRSTRGPGGPPWLWIACGVSTGLACLQRALARRYDQNGWVVLACAAVVAVVARLGHTLVPDSMTATGLGTTAVAVFPFVVLVGAGLILRARVPATTWSMRIEGLTAFFSGVSVASVFITGGGRMVLADQAKGPTLAPMALAVMAGAALGGLALAGGRGGRVGMAMAATLLALSAGTIVAEAHPARTELLSLVWAVGLVLIAISSAVDDEHEPVKAWQGPGADSSLASGMAALAVVAWGLSHPLGEWATVPALLALIGVGVRGVLTRHDARALTASQHQARTDDLTGLANRRHFYEQVEDALRARDPRDSLAVLVVDLDRFKEINDSLGHHAGDEVLRQIGPRLAGAVSVRDVLARLGGDEFAVLCEGGDIDWVVRTPYKMRDALDSPFMIGEVQLTVDASVGVAMWPDHAETLDDLMARADIAMYRAKSERCGVRTYEERGDAPTWERLHLLELLRTAVHADDPVAEGLVVHYQPKLHVKSGEAAGVEALVRFDHPNGTMLFPDLFIAMVENAGLMMDLTLAVMRIAVQQCQDWRRRGITLNVAVNVSASNLLDLAFPHQVMSLLKEFDLPPSCLSIEVTESSLMQDRVRCLDVLHRLRAIGIKISVDDYGTGHSSLAYLRDLPADELKLDRTFVQGMAEDPKVSAIVESTVALAHALDLQIVAEGVETDDDLDRLRQFDVDVVQGYLFSRPLSPDDTLAWYCESYLEAVVPPEPVPAPVAKPPLFGPTAIEADDGEEPMLTTRDEDLATWAAQEVIEPEFEIQGIDWIPLDAS